MAGRPTRESYSRISAARSVGGAPKFAFKTSIMSAATRSSHSSRPGGGGPLSDLRRQRPGMSMRGRPHQHLSCKTHTHLIVSTRGSSVLRAETASSGILACPPLPAQTLMAASTAWQTCATASDTTSGCGQS